MFSLAIRRNFESKHNLIGADWGPENDIHAHQYLLEVSLEGPKLNEHGFLLDIVDVDRQVDQLLETYRGETLNLLPEFEGLNPSLERFARILCAGLAKNIGTEELNAINIKLWEDQDAWASFRLEF
jgi:6-pyruvoyltetrahydropterin/6-carboxytetrahydropterin synthase